MLSGSYSVDKLNRSETNEAKSGTPTVGFLPKTELPVSQHAPRYTPLKSCRIPLQYLLFPLRWTLVSVICLANEIVYPMGCMLDDRGEHQILSEVPHSENPILHPKAELKKNEIETRWIIPCPSVS